MYKLVVFFSIFMAFSGPASAGLLFNFSDNGGNTTLLTASGTLDLTGSTPATNPWDRFIGWDDNIVGNTGLVADSDLFLFNNPAPSITGFQTYNSVGTNTLSVGGIVLSQTSSLLMDGGQPDFAQFFALSFSSPLAQTGTVGAIGSAVLNFSFVDLPYAAGTTLDLMQDQSIIFHFGAASSSVPEPSFIALLGLGIFSLGLSRRKMKS